MSKKTYVKVDVTKVGSDVIVSTMVEVGLVLLPEPRGVVTVLPPALSTILLPEPRGVVTMLPPALSTIVLPLPLLLLVEEVTGGGGLPVTMGPGPKPEGQSRLVVVVLVAISEMENITLRLVYLFLYLEFRDVLCQCDFGIVHQEKGGPLDNVFIGLDQS